MKLVYVTDVYPKLSEVFISWEILGLERHGAEIAVYSLRPMAEEVGNTVGRKCAAPVIYESSVSGNVAFKAARHLICLLAGPGRYLRALRLSRSAGLPDLDYRFRQLPTVCRVIAEQRPQRIHCHFGRTGMLTGWLASHLLGLPFSVTLHGSDVLLRPYPGLATVLRDASFVVCTSEKVRQVVSENHGVDEGKLKIVHCGVDLDTFPMASSLPEELKILCVARLHPVKGLKYLIRACEVLVRRRVAFECDIVGEGGERDDLMREIRQKGLDSQVRLPGSVPNENLAELYGRYSIFVLPSLSEGLSVVLMEAMACGLPVVASRVGGLPELVEEGLNGRLVEPEDPVALADAIVELHGDRAGLEAMRRRNRGRIENRFNLALESAKLYSLFRS